MATSAPSSSGHPTEGSGSVKWAVAVLWGCCQGVLGLSPRVGSAVVPLADSLPAAVCVHIPELAVQKGGHQRGCAERWAPEGLCSRPEELGKHWVLRNPPGRSAFVWLQLGL